MVGVEHPSEHVVELQVGGVAGGYLVHRAYDVGTVVGWWWLFELSELVGGFELSGLVVVVDKGVMRLEVYKN